MQRNTGNTQAITVEYGFLDSTKDDVEQLKNNWQNYAEAVVRAVVEYLNLNYIPIEGTDYYTVKSGDSLWSISKKYGITANELKTANNLSNSLLSIGQVLKIPNREIEPQNTYVVVSGDSLYKIAQKYNTTVDKLKGLNNLTTNLLSIGQLLQIPVGETTNYYTVKSGDSLYKIAQAYNTTVADLINLNDLSTTLLSIGQSLQIPLKDTETYYIVKSGDSLYKIAQTYNTTVDNLKVLNDLTTNLLSVGQTLKVK